MKIGDLVKVRNPLRGELSGQIGIIVTERYNKYYVKVHICGKTTGIYIGDLELICKEELERMGNNQPNNNNQPYSC